MIFFFLYIFFFFFPEIAKSRKMKSGNLKYFKKKEENQIYENLELLLRTKFFCQALLSFFFFSFYVFGFSFFLRFSLFLSFSL
ncbi:hypothetical protein ACB098_03G081700 [Castanea mollissima]